MSVQVPKAHYYIRTAHWSWADKLTEMARKQGRVPEDDLESLHRCVENNALMVASLAARLDSPEGVVGHMSRTVTALPRRTPSGEICNYDIAVCHIGHGWVHADHRVGLSPSLMAMTSGELCLESGTFRKTFLMTPDSLMTARDGRLKGRLESLGWQMAPGHRVDIEHFTDDEVGYHGGLLLGAKVERQREGLTATPKTYMGVLDAKRFLPTAHYACELITTGVVLDGGERVAYHDVSQGRYIVPSLLVGVSRNWPGVRAYVGLEEESADEYDEF